jgi:hypothetical protein
MQRHLVVPLSTSEDAPDITNQIVQSILDQAHLCPLPASSRPVYWQLDHAMRLFPVPHLVIQYPLLLKINDPIGTHMHHGHCSLTRLCYHALLDLCS